jgi:hypothetical protein
MFPLSQLCHPLSQVVLQLCTYLTSVHEGDARNLETALATVCHVLALYDSFTLGAASSMSTSSQMMAASFPPLNITSQSARARRYKNTKY